MKLDSRAKALQSARELMLMKGKDGVRMQEIADHAGINKGLLHYYFKNKEVLFRAIFIEEFKKVYGDINDILESQETMEIKLSSIIDRYFELLWENPKLPTFVMFEINKNPKLVKDLSGENKLQLTIALLDNEFKRNGFISSPSYAFQVILNIISMCIFPFMMRPMVEEMGLNSGKNFEIIMKERKEFLKTVVINSFRT
jgi:AcrR family transcriptional regulator